MLDGSRFRRDPSSLRIAAMRYVITGGSGYIGSRLVDLLARRDDTEKIVICDVAAAAGLPAARPSSSASTCATARRCAPCSSACGPTCSCTWPSSSTPRTTRQFVYDVDVNGTHNVLEAAGTVGHAAGAGHDVGGRLRRLPGQPGAADRGRPGARRGRLLVRARQDRVGSPLPALGGDAPGARDDDRAALHRVRPERRQLPGAALDQAAVRGRRGHDRPRRSSSSTRTTWSRGSPACCSAATRGAFNVAGDGLMTNRECAELIGVADPQAAAARSTAASRA